MVTKKVCRLRPVDGKAAAKREIEQQVTASQREGRVAAAMEHEGMPRVPETALILPFTDPSRPFPGEDDCGCTMDDRLPTSELGGNALEGGSR